MALSAIAIVLALTLPFYAGVYLQHTATIILTYLCLALSWDMLLRTGQISFGVAGFFGIGAYIAVLTTLNLKLDPILSILVGGAAAMVVALLLGLATLQLRGMYFAITTLALTEIFRVIVRNLTGLTGGPEGAVLPSAIFNGDPTKTYWLLLTITLVTIAVSEVFQRTRVYYAITSIRNDELVARSSGIDIFKYLVFIFVVTSAIQGIVGGAYAQQYAFVSPEGTFHVDFTLLPMAMCLLGGMHSTLGAVLGALILGSVAEYLKLQLPYGHLLIYGVIITMVILLMPKGVAGKIREQLAREQ